MLILREKKNSIFKMLTLVQDSNANAKEILDLVLWLEFKLVTTHSYYPTSNIFSVIIKLKSP